MSLAALRYKGKPYLGANKVADKVLDVCFCKFVGVGRLMDQSKCNVHTELQYPCDRCICGDYRPSVVKRSPNHWPLCTCGHIAQEHN